MKLIISSIDKILWEGEANSVHVPGADGDITILSRHMPLISLLRNGKIIVRSSAGVESFDIEHGMIDVSKENTTILL